MQPNPLNSPVIQVIQPKQETAWSIDFGLEHHLTDTRMEQTYNDSELYIFLKVCCVYSECYRMKKQCACVHWTIMCTCPKKTLGTFLLSGTEVDVSGGPFYPRNRVICVLTVHSTSTLHLQPIIDPIMGILKVISVLFCLCCIEVRQAWRHPLLQLLYSNHSFLCLSRWQ